MKRFKYSVLAYIYGVSSNKACKGKGEERGIPLSWINKTLENPTAIAKGNEGKEIVFKEFGADVVEVVFVRELGKIIVISVRWG